MQNKQRACDIKYAHSCLAVTENNASVKLSVFLLDPAGVQRKASKLLVERIALVQGHVKNVCRRPHAK